MDLQVALQVQVGYRVLVRDLEQLGKSGIGENATLVGGVKAVVLLHVGGHKLRHLRLGLHRAAGQAHKGAQLGGQTAGLEECIVCTTGLPGLLLLRSHILGLLGSLATLGILDLPRSGLHSGQSLLRDLRSVGGDDHL